MQKCLQSLNSDQETPSIDFREPNFDGFKSVSCVKILLNQSLLNRDTTVFLTCACFCRILTDYYIETYCNEERNGPHVKTNTEITIAGGAHQWQLLKHGIQA